MDFEKALLKEHSRRQAEYISGYVGKDKKKFAALLQFFLCNNYRLAQRAAYSVNLAAEKHPELLNPHLPRILKNLENPTIHDAVKRNTLRLLPLVNIPQRLHAKTIELSFGFFTNKAEPIAIRVFAMTVLAGFCKKYPELGNELVPLIEIELAQGAEPAIKGRGQKILKALQKHKAIKG